MSGEASSPVEIKIEDGVLSDSKKIKKSSSISSKSPSGSKPANLKKYETFCNAKKTDILIDIKEGLINLRKQDIGESAAYAEDVFKLLDGVDLEAYNKLLKTILAKHVDTFNPSAKILTQWRKKIKCWIHNAGRPETRGKPLIPVERLDTFRARLVDILKSLPYRAFPLLRSKILGVLEEFAKIDPEYYESSVFNGNSCSKHWWFNFMQKNQDIKKLWEQIPLERIVNKIRPEVRWPREEGATENSALCVFDNPLTKPAFQTIPEANLNMGSSLTASYASFAEAFRNQALMTLGSEISSLAMKDVINLGMNLNEKAEYDRTLEETAPSSVAQYKTEEEKSIVEPRPTLKQEMKQEEEEDDAESVQEIKVEDDGHQRQAFEMNRGARPRIPQGLDAFNVAQLFGQLLQPSFMLPSLDQKKALYLYLLAMKGMKMNQ